MNPYFSIITPVHNQENILEKCVRSLQAQTDPDFEVIFVDDGSTDGSAGLLREMTKGDPRFRLVQHDRNRSVLEARRTGMEQVTGQRVLFVDIDDYLEAEALSVLREALAENPVDILSFQMWDDTRQRLLTPPKDPDRLRALLTGQALSCLMYHAISAGLIRQALPCIQPGYCNMGEDYYISTVLLTFARSCGTLDRTLYHYITGQGMSTSMSGVSMEKLKRQVSYLDFALDHMKAFLAGHNPSYLPYLPQTRYAVLTGTLWQYIGKEVTWPMFVRYISLFDTEEDRNVFEWACSELLLFRAGYELKEKKQEKQADRTGGGA